MATAPDVLDDLNKVKTRVMDNTMADVASLADNLGYGWCSGCSAENVGENFRRYGDTWSADQSGRCVGYMSNHRLSIAYSDWSFVLKDITYGAPKKVDLETELIKSGTVRNFGTQDTIENITQSVISVRNVFHTQTSEWKHSDELNILLTYKPRSRRAGYKFNYENNSTTTDETNSQQSETFTINSSKRVKPNSTKHWRITLSKTRTSVTYTATIVPRFSTQLRGFLRYGGRTLIYPNFHYQYHGKEDRPTFNYTFGNSSTPFYAALRQQSNTNSQPWLWNDIINYYPNASGLISDLCSETRYGFNLTGQFDDFFVKVFHFQWIDVPLSKRSAESDHNVSENIKIEQNFTNVDVPLSGDPPVKLEPPEVNIFVKNKTSVRNPILTGV